MELAVIVATSFCLNTLTLTIKFNNQFMALTVRFHFNYYIKKHTLIGLPLLLCREAFEPKLIHNVDLNGDNQLSLDELEALQAKIMERQRTMTVRVEPTPDVDQPSKKKSNKDNPSRKPAL